MILEIAIVGATLVDLDGGAPTSDAVVVIEGERIRTVGSSVPDGADVVRADGAYLIPGRWTPSV